MEGSAAGTLARQSITQIERHCTTDVALRRLFICFPRRAAAISIRVVHSIQRRHGPHCGPFRTSFFSCSDKSYLFTFTLDDTMNPKQYCSVRRRERGCFKGSLSNDFSFQDITQKNNCLCPFPPPQCLYRSLQSVFVGCCSTGCLRGRQGRDGG